MLSCLCLTGARAAKSGQDSPDTPAVLFEEATRKHRSGDLQGADRLYRRLVPGLRQSGDQDLLGRVLNRMSLISSDQGRYFEALDQAREAVQIRRSLGDRRLEGISLNNLGQAQLYLGDYPEARRSFEQALELDRQLGNAKGEILRLNNIANADFFQGRYLDALTGYQQALRRLDETAGQEWNPEERRHTLANLAVLLQKLGRYERALSVYRELLEIPTASPSVEARQLSNLGTLYRHLGDPQQAMQTYRRAQQLFQQQEHRDGELGVLKNIGILQALELKDPEAALGTFEMVADLAQISSNRREAVQAKLYQAEVLRRLGRIAEARGRFGEVADESGRLGMAEEEWKALYGLGLTVPQEESVGYLRKAVEVIESVRSRLGAAPLKSEFLSDKRQVYDSLIAALLRDPGPGGFRRPVLSEAFQWMEKSRARSFQDLMDEALEKRRRRRNSRLAGRLREIRAQTRSLYPRLLDASFEEQDRFTLQLARLEAEYADTEAHLEGGSASSQGGGTVSLDELSARLPEKAFLVSYWTGSDQLVVFMLGPHGAAAQVREWGPGQSDQVERCRDSLSEFGSQDWRGLCRQTAETLLGGVLDQLPEDVDQLVIVPDGVLAPLPFEALPLPGGDLLLERFSVSYLPSASLLPDASGAASHPWMPWAFTLAGYGDPVVAATDDSFLESPQSWPPLPESARELRQVAELLPGREHLFLGRQARKASLFEEGGFGATVLHLSTHAAVDNEFPERSRILFSPGEEGRGFDYLFLGEVLDLDLSRTELVTLSACDTARGRNVAGEGIQAFSQVFLLAGARSTVASLWKVSDQAAARLMPLFYSRVAQGLSRSEALRQAKLDLYRSASPLAHPAYWAAFVLNGEGARPIPLPWSWPTLLAIAGLIAVAVLFFGFQVWRTRRRPG